MYEIETFKDILFGQIDTLQRYFDACAEFNQNVAAITTNLTDAAKMGGTTIQPMVDGGACNEGGLNLGGDLRPVDFKVCWGQFGSGVVGLQLIEDGFLYANRENR